MAKPKLLVKYMLMNKSKDIKFLSRAKTYLDFKLTVGVEILPAKYLIENQKVMVQFWDLGLQERFSKIRPNFYKSAHGAVILSSISNETEFSYIEYLIKEIIHNVNIPILIFDTGDSSQFLDKLIVDGATISKFRIGKETQGLIKEEIKKSIKKMLLNLKALNPDSNFMDYEFLNDDF
ncbi:MAG: hypothetical protein ACTSVL_10295 [Promethearchaeota archaeon]